MKRPWVTPCECHDVVDLDVLEATAKRDGTASCYRCHAVLARAAPFISTEEAYEREVARNHPPAGEKGGAK